LYGCPPTVSASLSLAFTVETSVRAYGAAVMQGKHDLRFENLSLNQFTH
jgi:hypothetical protein